MHSKCIPAGPVALVAALALVGCGSASKPLTKSQYAARANAICQQVASATVTARATIDKLPPPRPGSHPTAAQFTQAVQAESTESAAMTAAATKLRALGTPLTAANQATDVSIGIAKIGADEAALARAARSHDIQAVGTAFGALRADADHLGPAETELGLTACTQI